MHSLTILLFFFFSSSCALPDLHSFPTRRSSDLARGPDTTRRDRARAVRHPAPAEIARGGRYRLLVDHDLRPRSEEHTSELQSPYDLVYRLLLEKEKKKTEYNNIYMHCQYNMTVS